MSDLDAEHILSLWKSLPNVSLVMIQVTTAVKQMCVVDRTVYIRPEDLLDIDIAPGAAMHWGLPVRYDLGSTRLLEHSGYHVDAEAGTWLVQP